MIAQQQFDFRHVSDEELYDPDRVFWQGKEAENAAWKAEMQRRKDAKQAEQERVQAERAAERYAIKGAMTYSEAIALKFAAGLVMESYCSEFALTTICRLFVL